MRRTHRWLSFEVLVDEQELLPLAQGMRQGDQDSLEKFCRLFGPALERIAHRQLAPWLAAKTSTDSILNSLYLSLFERLKDGHLQVTDGAKLWALICGMLLNKVRDRARRFKAGVRNAENETPLAVAAEMTDSGPAPDIQVLFAEEFERFWQALEPQDRQIAELKIQGRSHDEIAADLDCATETVRRRLQRLCRRLESDWSGPP